MEQRLVYFFIFSLFIILITGCLELNTPTLGEITSNNYGYTGKYKVGYIATDSSGKDGMAIIGNNFEGKYTVKKVYLDCSGKGWHTNGAVQTQSLSYQDVESRYPIRWGGVMDTTHIPDHDVTCKGGLGSSTSSGASSSGASTPSSSYTSIEKSKNTISYINSLRQREGKSPLIFDSRVYSLALARANDMVKYNYLDHVNPKTGTCPDNMKYQYGFGSYEYLAENGFWSGGGYSDTIEKQAVDQWMTSTGHHYNLMYEHSAGAVACSNGYCVFLGLNDDRFGEGCHTAAEGIAYWNSRR